MILASAQPEKRRAKLEVFVSKNLSYVDLEANFIASFKEALLALSHISKGWAASTFLVPFPLA